MLTREMQISEKEKVEKEFRKLQTQLSDKT